MVSLSDYEFIDRLIENVKEHRCLFDKSDKLYFNKMCRNKAWENVANDLNKPVIDCQKRWKNLRERYSKEKKRRELPSGSGNGTGDRDEWAYYPQMEFLKDSIKPRKTKMEIENVDSPIYAPTMDIEDIEDPLFCSPPETKRKIKMYDVLEDFASCLNQLKESINQPIPNVKDQIFLKTVSSFMRDLPPQNKDRFQGVVLNIMRNYRKK